MREPDDPGLQWLFNIWLGLSCVWEGMVSFPSSGLTIGLAYEKITKIIPLFVVLCVVSTLDQVLHLN